jgi:AraC-like DNA-binding protein
VIVFFHSLFALSFNKPAIPVGKNCNVIGGLMAAGLPTLMVVAEQLDISPRTLQRRLADSDLTHSQLVKQIRPTKACQLLARQDVHISEIAHETGFASSSAFSRALQSWMGSSPRTFRNGL